MSSAGWRGAPAARVGGLGGARSRLPCIKEAARVRARVRPACPRRSSGCLLASKRCSPEPAEVDAAAADLHALVARRGKTGNAASCASAVSSTRHCTCVWRGGGSTMWASTAGRAPSSCSRPPCASTVQSRDGHRALPRVRAARCWLGGASLPRQHLRALCGAGAARRGRRTPRGRLGGGRAAGAERVGGQRPGQAPRRCARAHPARAKGARETARYTFKGIFLRQLASEPLGFEKPRFYASNNARWQQQSEPMASKRAGKRATREPRCALKLVETCMNWCARAGINTGA